MKDTKVLWAIGGALLLVPLLAMPQERTRARDNSLQMHELWRPATLQRGSAPGAAPENLSVRKQIRIDSGFAPQGQSPTDMDLTRQIRRAVLQDASLSPFAHNVRIIVRDGQVTLKGPVRSEGEKTAVEQKAALVVGKENVKSEVEVSPGRGQ